MTKKGLFLRKSMHAHFDQVEEGEHALKRHLGPFHLTAIGIGAIIGAGIFVIVGQAAASYAGPAVVLSFIIAAVICLLAGLCYAELSSMIPIAGGSYAYSYVAMGEFVAWIVGWTLTAQYIISASTVAVGWSGYFVSLMSDFGVVLSDAFTKAPLDHQPGQGWVWTGSIVNLPAVILVAFLSVMISFGIRVVSYFNNVMVVIKISTIILFIILGITFINTANWTPFIPENTGQFGQFGWSGIIRGAGLVFFAYIGFDTVSTLALDAKNPQRDLPKGILGSLGIATIAYVATALILTGVVSYTLLGVPDPMSVALNAMGTKFFWLNFIVKLAILAGLASVVLIQLLGQTRVFLAISKDGLLPKPFGHVNRKIKTPVFGALITMIVAFVAAGMFPVAVLGELVSMSTLFLFAIVCLGVLILRKTHPEHKRTFKVPLVPFVPGLGVIFCVAQMCFLPLLTWVEFLCWLAIGLIVYFSYSMKHSKIRA